MTSTVGKINHIRRSDLTALVAASLKRAIFIAMLSSPLYPINAAFSASEFDGSIEIESQSSFSRLKISIDESFKPTLQAQKGGFEITIPAATLMDIGVPFGAEDGFNQYLSTVKDERITNLSVKEKDGKLVITGRYHFPSGQKALASPVMEHFDFRRNEQGKFIADFFYKKGSTLAEASRKTREETEMKQKLSRESLLKKEAERRASREKKLIDSKNALLFCDQPVDRENTVIMKFKANHTILNFSDYFPETIPDFRFEYFEPKGDSEEQEMVRLALKLSRENKHALSIKTVEFLEKQYPKSKFMNEMRFLKANSYYHLEMNDKGRSLIQELARSARGSEVGLQSVAFLAVQGFKNHEWLAALDAFMGLKREMPNHPLIWLFRYGIAECLYQIRQTDQAKEEFDWVAKNAPKDEVRAEAAFKAGDLNFERGQYAQAILIYSSAIKKFEAALPRYPDVLLNLAESYFQVDELSRSTETWQKFLAYGKGRPNAWQASLRLAEVQGVREKIGPKLEQAFTETINSYPMSPGAVIARLRLIPCGNHGGFDLGGANRFFASPEARNFTGDGMVYVEPFKELLGLTEVRALISFQQDEQAVKKGIEHLRENPSVPVRRLIETAMIGGIKRILEKQLNSGQEMEAIGTYEKYGDFLPLASHDPMADDLRMKLAKVASERKLTSLALKLVEPYRQISEQSEKEVVAAFEKHLILEGVDEQEDRNLIEARTLWNDPSFNVENAEKGADLLKRLEFIRDVSKYAFERDLIRGLFYVDKKDFKKANSLAQAFTSRMTKLKPQERIQVWAWAGDVAMKAEDLDFAGKAYGEARRGLQHLSEKNQGELTLRHLGTIPSAQYLYESEGETLERRQKWKEAVALYSEAIENKVGGNHILYAHARAVLKEGGLESRKTASRSLEKIQQSQDDDVWKQLAVDQLKEIAKEGKVDEKRSQ